MQHRFAELTRDLFPRKSCNIFNSGIGLAKLCHVGIEVLMVKNFYYLIIHYSFKFADVKAIFFILRSSSTTENGACRCLYCNFNDLVVSVTGGVCAFTENLQIALL